MKKYLSRFVAAALALALLVVPSYALTVPQALELLEGRYYYGVPDAAYGAADLDELFEMLGDRYTVYMTAEEYQAFLDAVEDTVDMVGIGVTIKYAEGGLLVESLVPGGPAQEAGLIPGDLIVAVDGVSCAPGSAEARDRISGEEGTGVALTVLRDGSTQTFTVIRRAIHVDNTTAELLDGRVGYVDCDSFGADTDQLFAQALEQYDGQADCWLVDLRGNGGGYVDSALEMLAAVEGPGIYVYYENHAGEITWYGCTSSDITQKPLILLVDGDSASASELFASNVRDTGRGAVVGSRTFGKGVAQQTLNEDTNPEYFDGDALKVTTYRFYSAGGNTPDRMGVIPTLLVDDGDAYAVARALTGGSEETSRLCVMLGADPYYVDPEADEAALAALLSALPPQVLVFYNGGAFDQCTPAEAAQALGVGYENRWFSDVEDSPYQNAINAMGAYRLLNGTAPGRFSPEERFSRAQLCVMLARALNVTASGSGHFTDVPEGTWYTDGVNAIAELGLVNGVGDGKFDPGRLVTQEEFLTIMGRAARYINVALDTYGQELDLGETPRAQMVRAALSNYSAWARTSVAVLTWGLEDAVGPEGDLLYAPLEELDPSALVLREEAAAELYAMLAGLEILP